MYNVHYMSTYKCPCTDISVSQFLHVPFVAVYMHMIALHVHDQIMYKYLLDIEP